MSTWPVKDRKREGHEENHAGLCRLTVSIPFPPPSDWNHSTCCPSNIPATIYISISPRCVTELSCCCSANVNIFDALRITESVFVVIPSLIAVYLLLFVFIIHQVCLFSLYLPSRGSKRDRPEKDLRQIALVAIWYEECRSYNTSELVHSLTNFIA